MTTFFSKAALCPLFLGAVLFSFVAFVYQKGTQASKGEQEKALPKASMFSTEIMNIFRTQEMLQMKQSGKENKSLLCSWSSHSILAHLMKFCFDCVFFSL